MKQVVVNPVLRLMFLFLLLPCAGLTQSTGLVRLTDRDDLLGWEAVGRLDIHGKGYCSGTLIAPDLVLTAAHCVYDRGTHELHEPETMLFRAGLRDGKAIAERVVVQVAAPPQYIADGPRTTEQIRHDVAILRLAQPIVSSDADPFVLHSGPVAGTTVSVTSYGQGRSEALSRQRRCSIVAQAEDLMAFDCDVTFGSSGAPVFAHSGSRGRILSVISGGGTVEGRPVALGMSLPAVVAQLKSQLRATNRPTTGSINRFSVGARNQSTGAKFIKN